MAIPATLYYIAYHDKPGQAVASGGMTEQGAVRMNRLLQREINASEATAISENNGATGGFKLGLSGCGGGLESISSSQLLDLAERVEALGFTGVWLNEEHFQGSVVEVEGRRCHSPLILASAILARTRRLRVGFSVLLASLHHPVRLAEEIATLDVLSDGRIDLGISRGANSRYLDAYGVSPDDTSRQFRDMLTFLPRAWDAGTIELGGTTLSIEPKPVQKPHPPIYIGTNTGETAAWAVQHGHKLIFHGIVSMPNQRLLMRAFVEAGGRPAGQHRQSATVDVEFRTSLAERPDGLLHRPPVTAAPALPEKFTPPRP
jgi:alkanesulfonate monooxygenase SsuD/methylene tetrahydromethanopterin reductase-like flavin-dependent oxidoreductase (luciferase family)